MENQKQYLCAWAALDKLTFLRYQKIQAFYGDLKTAWEQMTIQGLISADLDPKTAEEIFNLKLKINPEQELDKLNKLGVNLTIYTDKIYPIHLKEIATPPVFLYYKGKIKEDETALAVVGSRQMSSYGKQAGTEIITDLARQGLTIISGLALGVDTMAHQLALKNGARTLAVVGNGLDQIYPFQNKVLAAQIVEQGAIISEFPFGTPPHNFNFPRRNRIISGLSLGVLVIEAKQKSGSLITARYAIEQNREIFAVPGNIYNQFSTGTNQLIQKGEAKLVTSAEDILVELNLEMVKSQTIVKSLQDLSDLEIQICTILSRDPLDFDFLQNQVSLETALLSSTLTLLEMKGLVMNLGNNQWVKSV